MSSYRPSGHGQVETIWHRYDRNGEQGDDRGYSMSEPDDVATADRELPRIALVREVTDRAVMRVIFDDGPTTRADIARATGISKPTVAKSVERLEQAGLLQPDPDRSPGAQRYIPFTLGGKAGVAGAVDVRAADIRVRFTDLFGRPVYEGDLARDSAVDDPAPQLQSIVKNALRDAYRLESGTGPLRSLALSFAHPVESDGHLIPLPDRAYDESALDPIVTLEGVSDAPVIVENDVNFAAIAEGARGAAVGLADYAYIHVGEGTGAALVLDGELWRGVRGLAGELSYVAIGGSDEPPRLGLPFALARAGFAKRSDTYRLDVPTASKLLDDAARGSVPAVSRVDRAALALGRAIASVCAVVDPAGVIIGGPIGGHPVLVDAVRAAATTFSPVPVPITAGQLGDHAAIDGAMMASLERSREDLLSERL